jgi:hypothetical protein
MLARYRGPRSSLTSTSSPKTSAKKAPAAEFRRIKPKCSFLPLHYLIGRFFFYPIDTYQDQRVNMPNCNTVPASKSFDLPPPS